MSSVPEWAIKAAVKLHIGGYTYMPRDDISEKDLDEMAKRIAEQHSLAVTPTDHSHKYEADGMRPDGSALLNNVTPARDGLVEAVRKIWHYAEECIHLTMKRPGEDKPHESHIHFVALRTMAHDALSLTSAPEPKERGALVIISDAYRLTQQEFAKKYNLDNKLSTSEWAWGKVDAALKQGETE